MTFNLSIVNAQFIEIEAINKGYQLPTEEKAEEGEDELDDLVNKAPDDPQDMAKGKQFTTTLS